MPAEEVGTGSGGREGTGSGSATAAATLSPLLAFGPCGCMAWPVRLVWAQPGAVSAVPALARARHAAGAGAFPGAELRALQRGRVIFLFWKNSSVMRKMTFFYILIFFTLPTCSTGQWLSVGLCLAASTAPLPLHRRGAITSALPAEEGTFSSDSPQFAPAEPTAAPGKPQVAEL